MDIKVERYIEETNNLIEAMLEVVLPDFMQITNLLKTVNTLVKGCDAAVIDAHMEIVKELQYFDTLTQKMQHIIMVHDLILRNPYSVVTRSDAPGANMIRLNHLQFQVACFEYLSSVNHIQTNLKVCTTCETFSKFNSDTIFQYSGILLTASRQINEHFVRLEKMCGDTDIDLLSKVDTITKIYSMESERSILNTYINKPMIHDTEIEGVSVATQHQSNIDLF